MTVKRDETVEVSADLLARIRELAKRQQILILEQQAAAKQLEEVTARLKHIQTELLPDLLAQSGVTTVTLDKGLWTISVKSNIQASIPKDRAEEAYAWLTKNKFGGMIKSVLGVSYEAGKTSEASKLAAQLLKKGLDVSFDQKVHPMTLKAWVRERLKSGGTIPPSIEYIDIQTAEVKINKPSDPPPF